MQATIAGKLWISWKNVSRRPITTCLPAMLAAKIFRRATRWRLPVRERLEPESALAGRRQRTDADYAGHRDAYRQYVQHSRLQRLRRSCWIRKPTSTSAPAICSTFISSSAITVSTPQRPITPGRAGYAAGRGTAPDGSTPWRLSRVFRFRKPAAT